jgi:hypothetical protein
MKAEMTGMRGTWFDSDRGQYDIGKDAGKGVCRCRCR